MPNTPVVLRASAVKKSYGGVHALSGVDLEIRAGEVHCLAGANGSGKSTLIKILSGVETADAGVIEIGGEEVGRLSVIDAISRGIQVIYQDLSLFPNLTVAENMAMTTRVAGGRKIVSASAARALTERVTARLGLQIDPDALLEELPVAQRQLVAICRALANDVKVLFMDEPTTALTWNEVETLFGVVRTLKSDGVSIVFVSHKTEEVFALSDRITVLRNGRMVAAGDATDFDRDSLVEALIGRQELEERIVADLPADVRPALRVQNLSAPGLFEDVSFDVSPGEIVGLTGIMGSGRSEVADAVFGIIPFTRGSVEVDGRRVRSGSVASAMDAGIAYVPADRLTQGVFLEQPISRNMIASSISRVTSRLGWLRPKTVARRVDGLVADLELKIGQPSDPVSTLSGGNQQRVVLAKWLATDPKVLVLNGPTVGVDIGSKSAILQILRDRAAAGMTVLLISDDIPELVSVCHRVLVVRRGRLVDEITSDTVTVEAVRERSIA
ncbi:MULTISPECIES: sugar ABC transporter ATP-binding protein [unclassified Rathayibacter]|uniref:sugar ABC transporter ATP-binding protein n=1 Tax=unclassified Rathayibacter TaxID=2609250 RepID=UPI0006FA528E|nr:MULTISPECIES: sugar ABC transporter ATP-binding protein [unclassified Rathayibacter]KQQ06055.1 lipase [Rathayibacter sp. Leaf294]KQS13912.1 lipase [Rathayibacter sp. Leaf185]